MTLICYVFAKRAKIEPLPKHNSLTTISEDLPYTKEHATHRHASNNYNDDRYLGINNLFMGCG